MKSYVVFLRGINVGGKNKIAMAELRNCLEELGFSHVATYIASGNIILTSNKPASKIKDQIEATLVKTFKLDSELIKVLVLNRSQLQSIVDSRPKDFGDKPDTYHSDAIFLIDIDAATAMSVFNPREGVDRVWPGDGVIYSQRLSSLRTKSRLSKIVGTIAYKSMTIRNWNTTLALLKMIKELDLSNHR
ncbi:MAG TPA: DUF1697 domain-containing protein [Candidatus Saccharimonadales bacterium]|nr:DUF1697 domain-containing protein [Candidatus Saccharimonadales bacterium]